MMKTAMEDMSVPDQGALPQFDRLTGVQLNGEAFANCLMVVEFCHNFKDALNFGQSSLPSKTSHLITLLTCSYWFLTDKDQLPTMRMLQGGLLNDRDCLDDFMQFTTNLLAVALDEPGVPNVKEVKKRS